MYSLSEIHQAWQVSLNPFVLRKFIGTPQMGWKVAWSDRMVSMYASVLLVSWIWYPVRRKLKLLPMWGFILFLLPMAVDGMTHMVSDFGGLGQGFRDSNNWLAQLTGFHFPAAFYSGDALGTFNSLARLLSGLSFGIGIVLFGFPYIAEIFETNLANHKDQQDKLEFLKNKAIQDILAFKEQKSQGGH